MIEKSKILTIPSLLISVQGFFGLLWFQKNSSTEKSIMFTLPSLFKSPFLLQLVAGDTIFPKATSLSPTRKLRLSEKGEITASGATT